MKFAKPIAIVLGVLVVGAIAVFLVLSNAQEKEHRQRMEALERAEAMQKNAVEMQERLQKSFEQTYPSR